jgi:hypothetical protein
MGRRLIKVPTDAGFAICSSGTLHDQYVRKRPNLGSCVIADQIEEVYSLYLISQAYFRGKSYRSVAIPISIPYYPISTKCICLLIIRKDQKLYECATSDVEVTTAIERLKDAQKNDPFKTGTEEDTFVNAKMIALLLMETRDRHYKSSDL